MKKSLCFILLSFVLQTAFSQETASKPDTAGVIQPAKPRSSPMAISFYKKDDTYLKVVYGQPNRKGRAIFGSLVPYGKIWRTGANEATEITSSKDFRLGGKTLKAGTYTLFTIPDKDKWTVIINSELGQWGEYKYDNTKDILSVEVPVQILPKEVYEAFTIKLEETPAGCDLVMRWDAVRVAVPVTFGAAAMGSKASRRGR
jgi:Protein of unknown function (DUF2911)